MLKPAGSDLGRRWLAALLLVPIDEREELVSRVEKSIVEAYDRPLDETAGDAQPAEQLLHVADDPVQKDGYSEQTIRSYAPAKKPASDGRATNPSEKRS